jgi:CDP-diglyceride synthetase
MPVCEARLIVMLPIAAAHGAIWPLTKMADPAWIKKTAALTLVLALPALVLLVHVWRSRNRRPQGQSFAWWTGLLVLASYACWFVNVIFEWSVGLMIAWPLFGIGLSLLGCGAAFFADKTQRMKLLISNALLLVLTLSSIVAPN